MLEKLFLFALNMSLMGSCVVVFVLIARLLLTKAPKVFSYALWGVVLFRLLCPFSFGSVLSLIPMKSTPIPQDIIFHTAPKIDTGIAAFDGMINSMLPMPNVGDSINPIQVLIFMGAVIWVVGMVLMVIYSIVTFIKLKRTLMGATPLKENIYLADHISSPFVMGIVSPKIYLPSSLTDGEKEFIIAHERCHVRRFDHITRVVGFAALVVHWFNPLVWVAFVFSGKDMELSCDEAVMKKMSVDVRTEYSQSLLRFGTGKRIIHATPLAFGEGDTKGRIKNVLNYKKPSLWVIVLSVITAAAIGVGLMTNPIKSNFDGMETGTPNSYALNFEVLNSTKTHELTLKEGTILTVEVKMEQGEIDFLIANPQNENIYQSDKRKDSADFTVTIPADGVYTISITGNDAKGEVIVGEEDEGTQQLTHDQAVTSALFSLGDAYLKGECIAEGHVILGYDDSDEMKTKIYALTRIGWYSFQNNNLTKVSGGAFPAVITLYWDNAVEIALPLDGSDYAKSIEELFPKEYHDRIFKGRETDGEILTQQEENYARVYLEKIGRSAEIGEYAEFEYHFLTDLGVPIEVSNKLEDFYKEHSEYPRYIGNYERLENGVRMVYEMRYLEAQNEIVFIKYEHDTERTVERFLVDATTGTMIT